MDAAPERHEPASPCGAELEGPHSTDVIAATPKAPSAPVGSLDFLGALAVTTRVLLIPIALVAFFITIGCFNHATLFRPASEALVRFTYTDPGVRTRYFSSRYFSSRTLNPERSCPTASTSSYSRRTPPPQPIVSLSAQAEDLGKRLDASGAICVHGVDEWGSPDIYIVTTAALVVEIVDTLGLARDYEMLMAVFTFKSGSEHSNIPAADITISPEQANCRPSINYKASPLLQKVTLATDGKDLGLKVPSSLTLVPYNMVSSIDAASRSVEVIRLSNGGKTAMMPLFRGYYGGCIVRAVNATGVYVDASCEINGGWVSYGLMLQLPKNLPVCARSGLRVKNIYASSWEWISFIDPMNAKRLAMWLNTYRTRYNDSETVSVLPALVVVQILVMGIISMYSMSAQAYEDNLLDLGVPRAKWPHADDLPDPSDILSGEPVGPLLPRARDRHAVESAGGEPGILRLRGLLQLCEHPQEPHWRAEAGSPLLSRVGAGGHLSESRERDSAVWALSDQPRLHSELQLRDAAQNDSAWSEAVQTERLVPRLQDEPGRGHGRISVDADLDHITAQARTACSRDSENPRKHPGQLFLVFFSLDPKP